MVRPRCIVSYCKNQGRHKVPKDEARRNLWIEAIKHTKPKFSFGTYAGVCSDHFRLSDFSVTPSYWNNYHPARVLKKSAVPSVFEWNKDVEDEQSEEQPPIEDALSFVSDLLVVEVEEPASAQETVSFNPERVRATYSKGQTVKTKPNADPSLQTQNSTFTNANASNYTKVNPKKRTTDFDDDKFLITAVTNIGEKRLKRTNKPPNNSNIVGKVYVTKTRPQDDITSQFLPPTDIESSDNKDETSCLPLEFSIKFEEEVETPQNEDRLATSSLPSEVTVKTEPDDENGSPIEVEMLPIKQENNEEIVNTLTDT